MTRVKESVFRDFDVLKGTDYSEARSQIIHCLALIQILTHEKYSARELSNKTKMSMRTVYRYLKLIESLGFIIDQECFGGKYFIVSNSCPLCGNKNEEKL